MQYNRVEWECKHCKQYSIRYRCVLFTRKRCSQCVKSRHDTTRRDTADFFAGMIDRSSLGTTTGKLALRFDACCARNAMRHGSVITAFRKCPALAVMWCDVPTEKTERTRYEAKHVAFLPIRGIGSMIASISLSDNLSTVKCAAWWGSGDRWRSMSLCSGPTEPIEAQVHSTRNEVIEKAR